MARHFPKGVERTARRAEEYARGILTGGTLFEELGFYYVGPIDGHNLDHLLPVLRNVRDAEGAGPILVHAITQKGKGYAPAEQSADKYHGVSKFNVVTGEQAKAPPGPPSYTRVFADALIAEAEADAAIVAITAAMPSGTGLDRFAKRFPDAHLRCRHRRAARGDVRGGDGDRGPASRSARFTRPSCSAPTTRWCTTSRSSACRCGSRWTGRGWWARTGRRMRAASISPISAACRGSC